MWYVEEIPYEEKSYFGKLWFDDMNKYSRKEQDEFLKIMSAVIHDLQKSVERADVKLLNSTKNRMINLKNKLSKEEYDLVYRCSNYVRVEMQNNRDNII